MTDYTVSPNNATTGLDSAMATAVGSVFTYLNSIKATGGTRNAAVQLAADYLGDFVVALLKMKTQPTTGSTSLTGVYVAWAAGVNASIVNAVASIINGTNAVIAGQDNRPALDHLSNACDYLRQVA